MVSWQSSGRQILLRKLHLVLFTGVYFKEELQESNYSLERHSVCYVSVHRVKTNEGRKCEK